MLSQLVTRRLLFCCVFSNLKSSSLHSALSSTDTLISCSVFYFCCASFGKTVLNWQCLYFLYLQLLRRGFLGQIFRLLMLCLELELTVIDILCLCLIFTSHISFELMATSKMFSPLIFTNYLKCVLTLPVEKRVLIMVARMRFN